MTDTKHSQETVIRLPDKWFTLDEVAARWTRLSRETVTVDRLLHWEEIGYLRIAALLNDYTLHVVLIGACNPFSRRNILWPSVRRDESFSRKWIDDKYPECREYRKELLDSVNTENPHTDLIRKIFYPFVNIAKQLRNSDEVVFSAVYQADNPCEVDFMYNVLGMYLPLPDDENQKAEPKVKRCDLRITRIERDRFEQKHGLGKPAPMPTINEDTELKRAYRALGALVMQLASDKPKFMSGNKPNVSQIAEYALNAASDSQGKAPHGYSNTTLRDAIATALNTVNKDLSNR